MSTRGRRIRGMVVPSNLPRHRQPGAVPAKPDLDISRVRGVHWRGIRCNRLTAYRREPLEQGAGEDWLGIRQAFSGKGAGRGWSVGRNRPFSGHITRYPDGCSGRGPGYAPSSTVLGRQPLPAVSRSKPARRERDFRASTGCDILSAWTVHPRHGANSSRERVWSPPALFWRRRNHHPNTPGWPYSWKPRNPGRPCRRVRSSPGLPALLLGIPAGPPPHR